MASPNWAETATAVASAVVALTGAIALLFAWQQLRQAHEQSKIQHLLQFERDVNSEPLMTYRWQLAKKRLNHEEKPSELYGILDFFETVGLLVRRGYLDASDVWSSFGYTVINLFTDSIDLLREIQQDDRTWYSNFTLLVLRLENAFTVEPPFRVEDSGLKPGATMN